MGRRDGSRPFGTPIASSERVSGDEADLTSLTARGEQLKRVMTEFVDDARLYSQAMGTVVASPMLGPLSASANRGVRA